ARPREHARHLPRPSPAEALAVLRCAPDLHGARRRLRDRVMRGLRDVRTRLFLIVVAALAVGLICATIAFTLLLAHSAAQDADSLLRQRVSSERAQILVV